MEFEFELELKLKPRANSMAMACGWLVSREGAHTIRVGTSHVIPKTRATNNNNKVVCSEHEHEHDDRNNKLDHSLVYANYHEHRHQRNQFRGRFYAWLGCCCCCCCRWSKPLEFSFIDVSPFVWRKPTVKKRGAGPSTSRWLWVGVT